MTIRIEKIYESLAQKAFKEQYKQIQYRASVGHEADCKDIFACHGCFKQVPDKIVTASEIERKKIEFDVI